MSDVVIRADGLGKRYLIGHESERERYIALRDVIARGARNLMRSAGDMMRGRQLIVGDEVEEFWALKDIDFEIKRGEVVGIIGRNGAGKSTLLKILSRITEPSTGRVEIRGRVASLLEVGTGFHPELTGRENIFLNGAILGMTRAEIRRKFDEIVAFAEIEKFLDTPVKRYSSGMYVRLAFAVAAHLEPEILIVDEVLAVGDAEFQKKCLGKMGEMAHHGRTVLLVSHNMMAVRQMCRRAIVLRAGSIVFDGAADSAVDNYAVSQIDRSPRETWLRPASRPIEALGFSKIDATISGRQPDHVLECKIDLESVAEFASAFVAIDILDEVGVALMQALPTVQPFILGKPGRHQIALDVQLPPLVPGTYTTEFWVGSHNTQTLDVVRDEIAFEVLETPTPGRTFPHTRDHGAIVPKSVQQYSFLGSADRLTEAHVSEGRRPE